PVSRPVTTTGEPKPPAPRAAVAIMRPRASARVDGRAFMEGMDSRREESSGSRLRDHVSTGSIGECGEEKGGAIESPTRGRVAGRWAWTRLVGAALDRLHSVDAAAPLPPPRRPCLPYRSRGVGRGCRGRGDDLGPRGRHLPRAHHVRRRPPAHLPQRPGEQPLLLLLRAAQALAGRRAGPLRAGGTARPRAAAPATVSRRRWTRATAGPRGRSAGCGARRASAACPG